MLITEKLKTETAEAHQLLESHSRLKLLMSEQLTAAAYAQVLALFYGYFAPLEQRLLQTEGLTRFLPDLPERRKTSALLSDLKNLPGGLTLAPLVSANAPLPITLAQAFGTLYVLEGSTLGGKFIAQQVSKTLGAEVAQSLSFFTGYGAQTGHYWKTFREALTTFNNLTASDEVIVASARVTFQHFHSWLSSHESEYRAPICL